MNYDLVILLLVSSPMVAGKYPERMIITSRTTTKEELLSLKENNLF